LFNGTLVILPDVSLHMSDAWMSKPELTTEPFFAYNRFRLNSLYNECNGTSRIRHKTSWSTNWCS